ncbi:NAD(P)H-binding protein [Deinococcus sp. YIM 134068]|uniref:SDR family oxidoreductase n=1 Tax=Deinococcus lichenicola TaxID=3118910 RepID=UPI002F93DEEF
MNDCLVLVTGGTGHLGRLLVQALLGEGARVRVLTRRVPSSPQAGVEYAVGNYTDGTGLAEALAGISRVIHTAHVLGDPLADARGTLHLLEAARAAHRPHFTFVSIVRARQARAFGYYAGKVRGEELVEASGLPALVFRAAQFHHFVDELLVGVDRLPWLPVPDGELQPVAVEEVAHELAWRALAGQRGTFDLAGPEVRRVSDLARAWLAARGEGKRVLPVRLPLPLPVLRAMQQGRFIEPGATRGVITWEDFLREKAARG